MEQDPLLLEVVRRKDVPHNSIPSSPLDIYQQAPYLINDLFPYKQIETNKNIIHQAADIHPVYLN